VRIPELTDDATDGPVPVLLAHLEACQSAMVVGAGGPGVIPWATRLEPALVSRVGTTLDASRVDNQSWLESLWYLPLGCVTDGGSSGLGYLDVGWIFGRLARVDR
jgi:hypothetical protein